MRGNQPPLVQNADLARELMDLDDAPGPVVIASLLNWSETPAWDDFADYYKHVIF
jgi:hypothetical protein